MLLELILYFAIALIMSATCSLTEAGFLSLSRADVARLVDAGRPSGRVLEFLKKRPDRSLAAILAVNTLANTVGAAGVGGEAEKMWGNLGFVITSGVLTVTILVFGEVVPKTIGSQRATRVAGFVAKATSIMLTGMYPAVLVLEKIAGLFGKPVSEKITRKDILLYTKIGYEDGTIPGEQAYVFSKFLALPDTPIRDLVVPWNQVFTLSADTTVRTLVDKQELLRYANIPVYSSDTDTVVGFVERHEIYEHVMCQQFGVSMQEILHPIKRVPISGALSNAFRIPDSRKAQELVLVEDDQGRVVGILTMEDALEYVFNLDI
jgi:CBS domain containing-hemolysin-like protein